MNHVLSSNLIATITLSKFFNTYLWIVLHGLYLLMQFELLFLANFFFQKFMQLTELFVGLKLFMRYMVNFNRSYQFKTNNSFKGFASGRVLYGVIKSTTWLLECVYWNNIIQVTTSKRPLTLLHFSVCIMLSAIISSISAIYTCFQRRRQLRNIS